MTPNKYTPFESRMDGIMSGINSNVREIRSMVADMSDKLDELKDTSNAVYNAVTYQHHGPVHAPDDDWDFLDED